jgi:hypothetical protein
MSDTVLIDADAAGYGWFVDETPSDDVEFAIRGGNGELVADSSRDAFGQMDLLTVVMHELGHSLGFEDLASEASESDVMLSVLSNGIRRTGTYVTTAIIPGPAGWIRSGVELSLLEDRISDWWRRYEPLV